MEPEGGLRLVRKGTARIMSKAKIKHSEYFLVCFDNSGKNATIGTQSEINNEGLLSRKVMPGLQIIDAELFIWL